MSSILSQAFGQPVALLNSGRFQHNGLLLPGAWLAAYTPLDGAMLLTTDPPQGFLGVAPAVLTSSLDHGHITFNFTNLSGMDLKVELRAAPSPAAQAPVHIFATSRNHTGNPLPISLAFSWQDLAGKAPLACRPEAQGMTIRLGDGSRIQAACSYPRTRFSCCAGWDPAGTGEEVWDDYFAYGELSGQQSASTASAVCAHALVAPDDNFALSIKLEISGPP